MTTMSSPVAGGARPAPPRFAAAVLRWRAQMRQRRRLRRELKDVSRLSRHLLRDIGIEDYADLPEPEIPANRR